MWQVKKKPYLSALERIDSKQSFQFSELCLQALQKMQQPSTGFVYPAFIDYGVLFPLIKYPLRKYLFRMLYFLSTLHYVVIESDENEQGQRKYLDTVWTQVYIERFFPHFWSFVLRVSKSRAIDNSSYF